MKIENYLNPEWMKSWTATLREWTEATNGLDKEKFDAYMAAMREKSEQEHVARMKEIQTESEAKLAAISHKHELWMTQFRAECHNDTRRWLLLVALIVLFFAGILYTGLGVEPKQPDEASETP